MALIACHHNKCCFTEAKFVGDDSHVEHFRPKGQVDDWPTGNSHTPGYYWLAFEWTNLFLCKSGINSGLKRNFFPLVNNALRNQSHLDTNVEVPLLIDPATDEPRRHIRFVGYEPKGITKRGRKTIEILDLRGSDITEARFARFKMLQLLKKGVDESLRLGVEIKNPVVSEIIKELKAYTLPEAEFSSMAKDFLSGWPPLR